MDEGEPVYEQTLFVAKECFTYRVPALLDGGNSYRCELWGLDSPVFTGECRIRSMGQTASVSLSAADKTLVCTIKLDPDVRSPASRLDHWVASCIDSSRYFVLRMVDEKSKRQAMIGIGFRERGVAYDFNAALVDWYKLVNRERRGTSHIPDEAGQNLVGAGGDDGGGGSSEVALRVIGDAARPALATHLAEGQKITLSFKIGSTARGAPTPATGPIPASSSSSSAAAIRPPPVALIPPASSPPPADDDDFGDFQQ